MCPHLPPPLHLLLVFCSAAKSLFTISLLCISHPYFGKFKTRFGTWDSRWKSSYGNPNLFLGLSFVNKSQQAAHVSGSSVIQKALRYIWELSKRSQVIFLGSVYAALELFTSLFVVTHALVCMREALLKDS